MSDGQKTADCSFLGITHISAKIQKLLAVINGKIHSPHHALGHIYNNINANKSNLTETLTIDHKNKYVAPPDSNCKDHFSCVMRKSDFCICENKGADQLCGNHTTDQPLCFCYIDSTIPLLPKSEISSL